MKEALIKLLKVKSIMTLMVTAVFCFLSAIGKVPIELFLQVMTMIASFYFGVQSAKKDKEGE